MNDFRVEFKKFIQQKGINGKEVAEMLEIKAPNLTRFLKYDGTVQLSMKKRIYKAFPDFAIKYDFMELKNLSIKHFEQLMLIPEFREKVKEHCDK